MGLDKLVPSLALLTLGFSLALIFQSRSISDAKTAGKARLLRSDPVPGRKGLEAAELLSSGTLAELEKLLDELEWKAKDAAKKALFDFVKAKIGSGSERAAGADNDRDVEKQLPTRMGRESGGAVDSARDADVYNAAVASLAEQVRAHARAEVVERCLHLIQGQPGIMESAWSQAGQEWFLFHNYFWKVPYGKGRYVDIGSNHPVRFSNTIFFDHCLGWRGICIEPNPEYHPLYAKNNRTCELLKIGVAASEESMEFMAAGVVGKLIKPDSAEGKGKGKGVTVVSRLLSDIIREHNMDGAEFATIDIEGFEYDVLRCFPFRAHGIKTWLVETDKAAGKLFRLFLWGGYSQVANILCPHEKLHTNTTRLGYPLDTVFRLTSPQLVLGPEFLPGRALEGKGPRPPCRMSNSTGTLASGSACPEQLPVVRPKDVYLSLTLKEGTCPVPAWNAAETGPGLPDAVLATNEHPHIGVPHVK